MLAGDVASSTSMSPVVRSSSVAPSCSRSSASLCSVSQKSLLDFMGASLRIGPKAYPSANRRQDDRVSVHEKTPQGREALRGCPAMGSAHQKARQRTISHVAQYGQELRVRSPAEWGRSRYNPT